MTIEAARKSGYCILYPRPENPESWDISLLDGAVRFHAGGVDGEIVLSLRYLSQVDHSLLIHFILRYYRVVRSIGGRPHIVQEECRQINSLQEICFFLNIPLYDCEEMLEKWGAPDATPSGPTTGS